MRKVLLFVVLVMIVVVVGCDPDPVERKADVEAVKDAVEVTVESVLGDGCEDGESADWNRDCMEGPCWQVCK
jgi:hypothetical protein